MSTLALSDYNTPVRVPMSWDEYLQLPESSRVEYYDGAAMMAAAPSLDHQDIINNLVGALRAQLGGDLRVTAGAGWRPDDREEEFIPDLMVYTTTGARKCLTHTPELVVEVLSSNRSDDLVVKTTKYARHGLVDYWIVDPVDPEAVRLSTYHLAEEGLYANTGTYTAGDAGSVPFEIAGVEVSLDLDTLLTPQP